VWWLARRERSVRARIHASSPRAILRASRGVGSSAAGIAACEAARERAPSSRITLVTADQEPRYSRPLLAYALAGRVARDAIDWRAAEFLERTLGVEVLAGVRATALRAATRTLVLSDGRGIPYDALVIATGARGQRLSVPGADLPGVFTLRDLEDLRGIEEFGRPGRPAVVVGGGNVGLQAAEALLERGSRSPWCSARRTCCRRWSTPRQAAASVRSSLSMSFGSAESGPGGDSGPGSRDRGQARRRELIEADLVVVGKGILPNVEWLAGSGVEVGRGVRVDRSGRTNVPGVFAAGTRPRPPTRSPAHPR